MAGQMRTTLHVTIDRFGLLLAKEDARNVSGWPRNLPINVVAVTDTCVEGAEMAEYNTDKVLNGPCMNIRVSINHLS
jgi:hypothetical protein